MKSSLYVRLERLEKTVVHKKGELPDLEQLPDEGNAKYDLTTRSTVGQKIRVSSITVKK